MVIHQITKTYQQQFGIKGFGDIRIRPTLKSLYPLFIQRTSGEQHHRNMGSLQFCFNFCNTPIHPSPASSHHRLWHRGTYFMAFFNPARPSGALSLYILLLVMTSHSHAHPRYHLLSRYILYSHPESALLFPYPPAPPPPSVV